MDKPRIVIFMLMYHHHKSTDLIWFWVLGSGSYFQTQCLLTADTKPQTPHEIWYHNFIWKLKKNDLVWFQFVFVNLTGINE
jgi:hypothetical protein